MMHEHIGRAGRARTAVRSNHAIGRECRFDLFRFEPLIQQIGRALGENLHQAGDIFSAQAPQAPAEPNVFEKITDAPRRKLGRRFEKHGLHDPGKPFQMSFVSREPFGIPWRKLCDLLVRAEGIAPKKQVPAVWKSGKERGVLGVDTIAVLGKF